MWHFISDEISTNINSEFICDDIRDIGTDNKKETFRISDGRLRFFVKVGETSRLSHFKAEIKGIEHLQKTQLFKIPNAICSGIVGDKSFLVLEFLSLSAGTSATWQHVWSRFSFAAQKLLPKHVWLAGR